MSIWCRRSLAGTLPGLERFAGLARQALEYYERMLGVPCPYPKYDIGFVPRLNAQAISIPGLMLVNENLLARMADPDDDFVAMLAGHEVSHLWFGCHIAARWWDDLWLDEAMASYVSYTAMAQTEGTAAPWTAFSYREKPRAYQADALPGRQPVSSPVATAADAMFRAPALTYAKGTAVIRQLAALIGDDALRAGLADYMRRFGGGTASLDDLIGCWSRSSGRDLGGWAQEWLRTGGASTLRASVEAGPDGTLASLAVEQDEPRDAPARHRALRPVGAGVGPAAAPGDQRGGQRGAVRDTGAARGAGPGRGGAQRRRPDLRGDRVRPGQPGGAGRGGDEHRRPADRGGLLERGLAAGDGRRAVRRRPGRPGDPAAGRLPFLSPPATPARLPVAGLEVLLERAVTAADRYTVDTERGGARAALAAASLAGASAAAGGSPAQRALAAGFAASAHTGDQLAQARAWLDGGPRPDGLDLDGDLRGRLLRTLAARGLAADEDLDALAAADPVAGERNRAACRAARPDAGAKEAAWELALGGGDRQVAEAVASALWVPGQEALLAGYRDRYFAEALPVLDKRDIRSMRRLARALYPVTLAEPATLAATAAAAHAEAEVGAAPDGLSRGLRLVLREQETIMVAMLAARSQPRRWP